GCHLEQVVVVAGDGPGGPAQGGELPTVRAGQFPGEEVALDLPGGFQVAVGFLGAAVVVEPGKYYVGLAHWLHGLGPRAGGDAKPHASLLLPYKVTAERKGNPDSVRENKMKLSLTCCPVSPYSDKVVGNCVCNPQGEALQSKSQSTVFFLGRRQ